jgi:hypothetical protein
MLSPISSYFWVKCLIVRSFFANSSSFSKSSLSSYFLASYSYSKSDLTFYKISSVSSFILLYYFIRDSLSLLCYSSAFISKSLSALISAMILKVSFIFLFLSCSSFQSFSIYTFSYLSYPFSFSMSLITCLRSSFSLVNFSIAW